MCDPWLGYDRYPSRKGKLMHKFSLIAGAVGALLLSVHSAGATEMGIYAGPGCDGLSHLVGYAAWLGAPAPHVTENFNQSSWSQMVSDAQWSIQCYSKVRSE